MSNEEIVIQILKNHPELLEQALRLATELSLEPDDQEQGCGTS